MANDESKQAADDDDAAGEASRVRYSCSQDARDGTGTTHDLDFFFFYEITHVGVTKVELPRLEVAYVFQLASKLLPCTGDTKIANESDFIEPSFVILAVDSAVNDEFLNTGENLETRDPLSRLLRPLSVDLTSYITTIIYSPKPQLN